MESDRLHAVTRSLFQYVKSPSLRHIRDPESIYTLAKDILLEVDRASSIWSKWEAGREDLLKAAAASWIPVEDLAEFLNSLPGPALTLTDVKQRLRAFWEEMWVPYPREEFKAGCVAIYEAEKAAGTGMTAIIWALNEHLEAEEQRLRHENEVAHRQRVQEERIRLQERFLAGVDCGWAQFDDPQTFFYRRNGRAFRVKKGKDKRWTLCRVKGLDDVGDQLGIYLGRGDANKIIAKIAYEPEPRW